MMDFYEFIDQEYQRVISNELLSNSIDSFNKRFKVGEISQIKIIAMLIWSYTDLLYKNPNARKAMAYS